MSRDAPIQAHRQAIAPDMDVLRGLSRRAFIAAGLRAPLVLAALLPGELKMATRKPAPRQMTRGERVIAFIERYIVVPDGKLLGEPMRLEPFQKKFILAIYDNPKGTRRAYLSIARKNGKSALIAAILLAHLIGPEAIRNTQIISGARSRDQAALIYDLASKMVNMSADLRAIVREVPSQKRLVGLPRNVTYTAISAEGKTAFGKSPVLAILDEVGQVQGPTDAFVDAITTSQGAHEHPLLIAISTQAASDADLFSVWIDDALKSRDPRIVCHLYTADDNCKLDDQQAWAASNPALGKFRSIEDMREQAERAMRMPSAEPTFRNYGLNQRCEAISPFISKGVWLLNSQEPDPAAFYEAPVYVGIDLSARNDLTAMVLIAMKDDKWHVLARFWTPQKGLKERARSARAPLDVWANQGLITAMPGASISYEQVAKDIVDTLEDMDVKAIAFDRWRFDSLKDELDKLGKSNLPLVEFGQGFVSMTPALEAAETALLNEQVAHGGMPPLTMCAMASRVTRDPAGNRKLDKVKSTGKIDGMVAMVMAFGIAFAKKEPAKQYQAIIF